MAPVLLLSAMAIMFPAPQTTEMRAHAIDVPPEFLHGEVETSLICRDGRGRWVTLSDWRRAAGPSLMVMGPVGRRCRVLVRPAGSPDYLTSREAEWGAVVQTMSVRPGWQRTVRAPAAEGEVIWIGASGHEGIECESLQDQSRCLFVPVDAAGLIAAAGARLRVALVREQETQPITVWRSALGGRLVRVRVPSDAAVEARPVVVRPLLTRGSGQMTEPRPASGVSLHRLTPQAFWVEGDPASQAEVEFRSPGAATTRIPLGAMLTTVPAALDIALPVEELLTGEVRSRGALIDGVTVMLARVLDVSDPATPEEERPLERIGEAVTDGSGSFAFAGLARGKYELLAVHPSRGRTRAVAVPPHHARLELRPRALIRGRVMQEGVPVSAVVQALPSIDAVAAARNPAALGVEPVRTGVDGRFELVAPDEGRVMLAVTADGGSLRMDLGEAGSLGPVLDLGDIQLRPALGLDVIVDLPAGCELQAAGPMGAMGLRVVRGEMIAPGRWRVALPLSGRWLFAGICGGEELGLDPPVIEIPPPRAGPILLKVRS
ncbi:MAG: carboxypeptidase-like regulatory domain-containing protein [Vicinamibacterales bacterium]